ncbi:MAG: hypothetical protein PHS95_00910 [Candidatus Pacebacteria bacterium]|nr:hypothetical protein [Candidatus Paceibacterota bacterium]
MANDNPVVLHLNRKLVKFFVWIVAIAIILWLLWPFFKVICVKYKGELTIGVNTPCVNCEVKKEEPKPQKKTYPAKQVASQPAPAPVPEEPTWFGSPIPLPVVVKKLEPVRTYRRYVPPYRPSYPYRPPYREPEIVQRFYDTTIHNGPYQPSAQPASTSTTVNVQQTTVISNTISAQPTQPTPAQQPPVGITNNGSTGNPNTAVGASGITNGATTGTSQPPAGITGQGNGSTANQNGSWTFHE